VAAVGAADGGLLLLRRRVFRTSRQSIRLAGDHARHGQEPAPIRLRVPVQMEARFRAACMLVVVA
jgi:hypothetical protein